MKLLILGAGGHGQVVKEVAEAMKDDIGQLLYDQIDFLDDENEMAIGRLEEVALYLRDYDEAFVGIGNNQLRKQYMEVLEDLGFSIPILIHPSAYVSNSAVIEKGVVIEPKVIVNANTQISKGTIVSVGAIVDHNTQIGPYSHINAGAICKAGSQIPEECKLDAGEVAAGY